MTRLLLTDVTVTRDQRHHHRARPPARRPGTAPSPCPSPDPARSARPPAKIVAAIDQLLDHHTTAEIAAILNQRGLTSGDGQPFHRDHRPTTSATPTSCAAAASASATGLLTLTEIASHLGVVHQTVKTWRHAGLVTGER